MGLPTRSVSRVQPFRIAIGLAVCMAISLGGLAITAELPKPAGESDVPPITGERLTADQLAQRIDSQLAELWKSHGIVPAPITSDEEFVRRVHLDLIGR